MCTTRWWLPIVAMQLGGASLAFGQPVDCSAAKIEELLSPATAEAPSVQIDCNIRLNAAREITKRILIYGSEASGIRLNLGGSTVAPIDPPVPLEIGSVKNVDPDTGETTWSRPSNILVRNAVLVGKTRIYGMGLFQGTPDLYASSRLEGHTARAQANAPRNITFLNVRFVATGPTPLYVSPGVTYVRLLRSEVEGESNSAAIYFAAESGFHLIKDSRIDVATDSRELIAVDGTARSRFINNWFSGLANGGLYLYRNCGENGAVRHQTPNRNQFLNNVFSYDGVVTENPAIWLASRNGNRSYCAEDGGFPFGSSASDLDFARNNVVLDNQFIGGDPNLSIRNDDKANVIQDNIAVVEKVERYARCYQRNLYPDPILAHGEASDLVFDAQTGEAVCDGKRSSAGTGSSKYRKSRAQKGRLPPQMPALSGITD